MGLLKTVLKIAVFVFAGLLGAATIFLLVVSPGSTPTFKDEQGSLINNSIADMEYIEIGGIEQFVLIRGESKDNPVLLVLHGGPGASETPMLRRYNSKLEEYFTVVYWDQRGAGKSYSENIPSESMILARFVEDAHELTLYLKERFNTEKIFLLGHSWGSFLGINTVKKYPDDYFAYIGTGQVSNQLESERLAYVQALKWAKERGDADAVRSLTELGQLRENLSNEALVRWVIKQREFVGKLERSMTGVDMAQVAISSILFFKEYDISDKFRFMDGTMPSLNKLLPSLMEADLSGYATELKVPVYLLQGEHDYVTSYSLAKEYFSIINAPKKEFFTFKKSGHSPPFEEPDRFNEIMIDEVLRESIISL